MGWAIEEMINIVLCLAAIGADVEASILTDSALVGAKESTMSEDARGDRMEEAYSRSSLMTAL